MEQQQSSSDIPWILKPQSGKGGLLLSGFTLSQDINFLLSNKIFAVLSIVVQNQQEQNVYSAPIVGRIYEVEDEDWQDLGKILEEAYLWIDKQRQSTNVLVHCIAGASRSPTVVIYYLMRKFGWEYEKAYSYVKERRDRTKPRKVFVEQLHKCIAKHQA